MDTDNSVVIGGGRGRGGGAGRGNRAGKWCWKQTSRRVVNTQYSVQMMCHRIVHLEHV